MRKALLYNQSERPNRLGSRSPNVEATIMFLVIIIGLALGAAWLTLGLDSREQHPGEHAR